MTNDIGVLVFNATFNFGDFIGVIFLSKKTFIKKKNAKKKEKKKTPQKLVYSVYMQSMKITRSIREDYGLWTKGDNYTSTNNDGW